MLKEHLQGVGVALVTPFDDRLKIDYASFKRLIEYVSPHVDFLVALGTTAESVTLSLDEKIALLDSLYDNNSHSLPIVVGVGGNHTKAVEQEISVLPLSQSQAVMSVAPYYNKPSPNGLLMHYQAIAKASPKPVILYNVPGRTSVNINADITTQLASIPNIQGIKEASTHIPQNMELLKNCPKDFLLMTGEDTYMTLLLFAGMDGIISVVANAFPRKVKAIASAALAKECQKSIKEYFQIDEAIRLAFVENSPSGIKSFLHLLGIISHNTLRSPLCTLSESVQTKMKNFLSSNNV